VADLTYRLDCPDIARNKARYFLALLAAITGLRLRPGDTDADIVYGVKGGDQSLTIPCQDLPSPLKWRTLTSDDYTLILPESVKPPLTDPSNRLLSFDIFAVMASYFENKLGSSNEPVNLGENNTDILKPQFGSYVNYFLHLLKQCGKLPGSFQPESPWPSQAPFALGLSYDIDILKRKIPGSLAMLANAMFTRRSFGALSSSFKGLADAAKSQLLGRVNPYCQFGRLFRPGLSSTVFIYARQRRDRRDPTYSLKSVKAKLTHFLTSDIELALHNGIGTWNSPEILADARQSLSAQFNKEVSGIRPHFLNLKLPDFWKNILGFKYSSSVGSDSAPGFTFGLNFPFFGFALPDWRKIDILELPIALMDCALFTIENENTRLQVINELVDRCCLNHGLLVIDWHNTSAYESDFPGWLEAHNYIINRARQKGAFIGSLGQISDIWRSRCESVFSF
jgi:hypothetical protein